MREPPPPTGSRHCQSAATSEGPETGERSKEKGYQEPTHSLPPPDPTWKLDSRPKGKGYMTAALAPATNSSYRTAWNSYSRFCTQHRIIPAHFNHNGILAFVVHLCDILQLSPTTIRSYLSGIQHHY
ncbi:UNVERIFIED_CONTAM: hypothetical protein FKN15_051220 [Acipenser sinensis]